MPGNFKCRKAEFEEYIRINVQYDQQHRMGRLYWATSDDIVIGYMVLAMGDVGMKMQKDLGIDTYGPVPSLTIARLATDERHERKGIGRLMVSYAIELAREMASDVGCRVVLANSEPDTVGFYEKMGFVKFKAMPSSRPRRFWHRLCRCTNNEGRNDYVPLYFDVGSEKPTLSGPVQHP